MEIIQKLALLFKDYQSAFINHDIEKVSACYHLPCTLNTPEQVTLLTNQTECIEEFNGIFSQLNAGDVSDIVANKATYSVMAEKLYLVCIDWDFIDSTKEVYADFAAIYHVLDTGSGLKIVNVTSHDLECTLTLSEPFSW